MRARQRSNGVVGMDPDAIRHRTNLATLFELFARAPATADLLRIVAAEVRANLPSDESALADHFEQQIRPRLTPVAELELFQQLRGRYDAFLNSRLLGNRSHWPGVEHPQHMRTPGASDGREEEVFWDNVATEARRSLAGARFSLRLAAQDGRSAPHLRRTVTQLSEAAEWYGLLVSERRPVSSIEDEIDQTRRQLDEIIDRWLSAPSGA